MLKFVQTLGEHRIANSLNATTELCETDRSICESAEDDPAPALAEEPERPNKGLVTGTRRLGTDALRICPAHPGVHMHEVYQRLLLYERLVFYK